jgi:hypothetical protein
VTHNRVGTSQVVPPTQSALVAQAFSQTPPVPHLYGAQSFSTPSAPVDLSLSSLHVAVTFSHLPSRQRKSGAQPTSAEQLVRHSLPSAVHAYPPQPIDSDAGHVPLPSHC